MKILHILPSLKGGGIQNFLLSLATEQVKMGNTVTVVVTDEDELDYSNSRKELLESCGIDVINLNRKVGGGITSFIKTIIRARKTIKSIHPDIVNSHSSHCHIIGSFVTILTDMTYCCTIHNAPELWSKLTKLLVGKKPMIFCSDSALKLRNQEGRPMVAINNGVDLSLVKTKTIVDLRSELKLTNDDKIVVLVGSQRPVKNYPFIIKIVEKMNDPNIHFCICGGNYKVANDCNNNKNYITTKQFEQYKNIHLLGLRGDIPAIHNGSDVYLSCSLKEGLPISALEAFFAGIPCVLSPIVQHTAIAGGIDECYIPDSFDEESFIVELRRSLECKKTHETIYTNREELLKKFLIERCAKEYVDFYRIIIKK